MPLVRYEIPNEHSLANPQLYRSAAKDDPEGLLEGVAMAGLVGIVRQLGDLADFAAEVFRDLHEEVMTTASRGHDLSARVQQLEAEMPIVEKALLSETNQLRFAYAPGAEWHASVRNYQNICTQGDLPRFIRNSYEECRGPPRLFLLDKFDVAGVGACLKRYTDPSFFRTEWASSELMKAERAQRDKKARREKKKGRRRRNAEGKDGTPVDPFHTRFSHELSKEYMRTDQVYPRTWQQPFSGRLGDFSAAEDNLNYNENLNAISRHIAEARAQDVTSANKVPVKAVPGKEIPVKGVPVKEVPFKEVPVKEVPVKEVPVKEVSVKEVPIKEVPVKEVPVKEVPVKEVSVKEVPVKEVPVKEFPVKEVPVQEVVDLPRAGSEVLKPPQALNFKSESTSTFEGRVRSRRWEENMSGSAYKDETVLQEREAVTASVDDGASEGDQFLDALTTMESEADTDSEAGVRQEADADGEADADTDRVLNATEARHSKPHDEVSGEEVPDPTSSHQLGSSPIDNSQSTLHETLKASGFFTGSASDTITGTVEQLTKSQGEFDHPSLQTLPHVERLQETLEDDSNLPRSQPSFQEHVASSIESSSTLQEDLRFSTLHGTSTGEAGTLLADQRITTETEVSSGHDLSHDLKGTMSSEDANGTSSGIPVHSRRPSITSISSRSSKKSSRVQWQAESRENVAPDLEPVLSENGENGKKGPTKPSQPGAVQSFSAGTKVSKMVAAFERGSLEEVQLKGPKDSRNIPAVSPPLESVGDSINDSSVEAKNAAALDDGDLEDRLAHDSVSPLLISPRSVDSTSTNSSSSRSTASPLRVRVRTASVSSHGSVTSLDSPLDSPVFSALHSPISPTRTRNILSSPDSQRLHIASELLSPGSPTAVPILALSPTSQRLRPHPFGPFDHGDHQTTQSVKSSVIKNVSSLTSSSSPAELSSERKSEAAGSAAPPIISETVDRMAAPDDLNDGSLPTPDESPGDLARPKPPAASSNAVSSVDTALEKSKRHKRTPISVPDVVDSSNADPEVPSPGARVLDSSSYAVPSQGKVDDTSRSVTKFDSPEHERPKAGGEVLMETIVRQSSVQSSSSYGAGTHTTSNDERDQYPPPTVPEASKGRSSRVSSSEAKADISSPAFTPAHKRVPSLTTVEGTILDSLSSPSKVSKDPPVVVTPSRRVPTSQSPVVPVVKVVHDVRSPSRPAQTLHNHPVPVPVPVPVPLPKPRHRRFPSFPPSESTAVELASAAASSSSSSRRTQHRRTSSAVPAKVATGVQVPRSKLVYGLQFPAATLQALHALPPPTPPSQPQQDFLYQQSTPFRTLHELPPPPPPLQTPQPVPGAKLPTGGDGQEKLLNAIASHDKSSLKKVKTLQNPALRKEDDRSHLLEQIRARSFNLRHTVVERPDPPLARPVTNINVAAILEKANAIRQAFAGSDEDDDGEDDWDGA